MQVNIWTLLRIGVAVLKVVALIALIITAYSGYLVATDALSIISSLNRGNVEKIVLRNRGLLPLTIEVVASIKWGGYVLSVNRTIEVPPSEGAEFQLNIEDIVGKLPPEIRAIISFSSIEARVEVDAKAYLQPFVGLRIRGSRNIVIGPALEGVSAKTVGKKPINSTHISQTLDTTIHAPELAGVEGRVRMWVNNKPSEWISFKFNEEGVARIQLHAITIAETKITRCELEICINSTCIRYPIEIEGG